MVKTKTALQIRLFLNFVEVVGSNPHPKKELKRFYNT